MLSSSAVYAIVPTKDLAGAKAFFSEKLQLEPTSDNMPGMLIYKCGGSTIQVYETQGAGTNQATTMGWKVDDVVAEVADLKSRGVVFEDYDFPGLKTVDGIASWDNEKAAWFKDPDGNILCVSSSS